jgi:hypothetical protein
MLHNKYLKDWSREEEWKCLDTVVTKTVMSWSGNVTCFKSNPLNCTLLAQWDEGYQDPWLIVTDLEPKQGNALWYGLRSWIESSYRDVKSDRWQWHKTRLREPARAERLWLAMAVATLWTVTVGSDDHQHLSEMLENQAISPDEENPSSELKKTSRIISCFLKGLLTIIADLLCGNGISLNGLFPQSSYVPSSLAVNTS